MVTLGDCIYTLESGVISINASGFDHQTRVSDILSFFPSQEFNIFFGLKGHDGKFIIILVYYANSLLLLPTHAPILFSTSIKKFGC